MTDGCRIEHVPIDVAATHATAWADLAARALEPNVFSVPAFAIPAARFIPGPRLRVLLVWRGARLVGLCLIAARLPGWPMHGWLHPQAVAAFPMLDASEAEPALAAMLQWARRRFHPGFLLSGMPSEGPTARLLATGPFARVLIEARSRAVLPGGQTAAGLAGKAGKEVRRQSRRLAERGALSFHTATRLDDVAAGIDAFLALEAAGWKGRRGTALGQSQGLSRFVRAMAAAMAAEGDCRIDRLELDGQPVAMGIVLRSGPTAYYWKTAFDERYARYSPGVQLTEAISRVQAGTGGLDLTDSCAVPNHAMIDRLWPARIEVEDTLVGTAGQGLAAPAALERLRRSLRSWVKHVYRTLPKR